MTHTEAWLLGYFIFSAVVSGMPDPGPEAGLAYRWAYHTLHILAGDLSQYIGSRPIQKP